MNPGQVPEFLSINQILLFACPVRFETHKKVILEIVQKKFKAFV